MYTIEGPEDGTASHDILVDDKPLGVGEGCLRGEDEEGLIAIEDVGIDRVRSYGSAVYGEVLTEGRHKVIGMRFVRFTVSFEDGYPRCLGLREQVERFHEGELELLDAGVEVLFAAEAAGVLEKRHYRPFSFVGKQGVGIDGRLRGLTVLLALMDDDGRETERISFHL